MDMYPKYKSQLGYQIGDDKIDSYGVDHSGFTTRDEVEYQFARNKREQELIRQYNAQGLNSNYPQCGKNFWGNPDNNYGFGTCNISDNIEAHPTMNTTSIPVQQKQTRTFDRIKAAADNFAGGTEAFSVGYTTGASLGNFDEIMGLATAAVTGKPDNYSMGRDAIRQLQSDLQQSYPYIYGGAEFAGAMTTPMHLVKDNTFVNKSFNALSDTISASVGYANNLDDFKTNLVANGFANIIGLKMEKLPLGKAFNSSTGKKLAAKGCKFAKQGINSITDKLKSLYYNDEE